MPSPLQTTNRVQGFGRARVDSSKPSSARYRNFTQFHSVCIQEGAVHTDALDAVRLPHGYKQVNVIIGLDLSTVFDTVNHETILPTEFGVTGMPPTWLRSYLEDGTMQFVKLGQH